MKKFTLLFLALSSLALAGVLDPTIGSNPISTPANDETGATAGVNVNVTATVTESLDLVITDLAGIPISDVNFNHVLVAGDVAGQGEKSLTANLKVKGTALTTAGNLTTAFKNQSLTLINGSSSLTSTLSSTPGAIGSSGEASLAVTSALEGVAAIGTYSTEQTTLTVTYNKTKK
ncbi:hypothetical protein [Cetobacterium somerae]